MKLRIYSPETFLDKETKEDFDINRLCEELGEQNQVMFELANGNNFILNCLNVLAIEEIKEKNINNINNNPPYSEK